MGRVVSLALYAGIGRAASPSPPAPLPIREMGEFFEGSRSRDLKSLAKIVRRAEVPQPHAAIAIGSAGGDATDEVAERGGSQSLKGGPKFEVRR